MKWGKLTLFYYLNNFESALSMPLVICLVKSLSLFAEEFRRGRIMVGKKRIVVKEYPSEAAVPLTESGFLREMQDYVLYR